jgi:hypothetical protein
MPSLMRLREALALQTRKKSDIQNEINRTSLDDLKAASDRFKADYPNAEHRPTQPCSTYNCHGLTFGSRRTWIWEPSEIAKILSEDDYVSVPIADVRAGDIIVYTEPTGEPIHSGLVLSMTESGPKILSKWGNCHEVIHLPSDCPFRKASRAYYRIVK